MSETSMALTRVGSHSNLVSDPAWQDRAKQVVESVENTMRQWQSCTIQLGQLLYQIDAEKYYLAVGCDSFAAFLAGHGWNRRRVNFLTRAYETLTLNAGLTADQMEGVDVELMLEAKKNITPNRAPKILESARQVSSGALSVADYRKLWVDPSFTPEPPAPRRAPAASAATTKVAQLVEGMLGWSPQQVTEAMKLLAEGLQRTSMMGPDDLASLVGRLDDSARPEFIRELFKTTDFFDEQTIRGIIRTGIRFLSSDSLRKLIDEIETALASAATDVSPVSAHA